MRFKGFRSELTLSLEGNIVWATFRGAASTELMSFFANSVEEVIAPLNGEFWALICISDDLEAATPEAEVILVDAIRMNQNLGCRVSCYVFPTALSRYQMDRALRSAGVADGIDGKLYATKDEAKAAALSHLSKIAKR
ncbi:hypothetical protein Q4575_14940 [Psychrosphaera sp. 1_MG-2023]|uniref:hypothetical protein n=1 Tax=Psychrosphaera sp. 1_MG-2023 TaxID=3062643 RepID=UPI0026E25DCF|nr:hypothetical protein [Psychrosphaera sp. 1_MG-2023]MDO6720708.1 hypothetical protein [Psychrosphaera sp. 1_MG-2023]